MGNMFFQAPLWVGGCLILAFGLDVIFSQPSIAQPLLGLDKLSRIFGRENLLSWGIGGQTNFVDDNPQVASRRLGSMDFWLWRKPDSNSSVIDDERLEPWDQPWQTEKCLSVQPLRRNLRVIPEMTCMPNWYLLSVNFHLSGHRQPSEEMRDDEELTQDVLELWCFPKDCMAHRSYRNRELIDRMRAATK